MSRWLAAIDRGDVDGIFRVSNALETGIVGANTGMISDAAAPFGGIKELALGEKDQSLG